MENLDGTIVTTAIPRIAADLGVESNAVGIIVTAYLVSLAVFIPVGGWLMTRYPARRIFAGAIIVFTLTSLACGFAHDLTTLAILRVAQGIGGALMVPVGRQVIFRDAPKNEVLRWMSYIVWPGLVAPVIAPLAGGVITSYASWEWIFWLNVPLGVIALVATMRLIPSTVEGPASRLDWKGFLLVGAGLGGLTWGAHLVADAAAPIAQALAWIGVSLVVSALAGWYLRRARRPLIDLTVLRDHIFGLSQAAVIGFWILVAAVPFLMPLMMQNSFGWSPIRAGVLVMFVFLGNIGIKPLTTPLLSRFSFRSVLIVSTIGLAGSAVAIGLCTASTPAWVIAALALVSGIFRSTALTAFSTVGFATIDTGERRAANTLVSVIQQVCTGLGVAVATVALSIGQTISAVPQGHSSYLWAFGLMGALGVIPVVLVWFLPKHAGAELRPARRARPAEPPRSDVIP